MLQKEAEKAKSREEKAQDKVVRLSEQILKAKEKGYTPTRGRTRIKSPSKCSKRHLRNLKRKREHKCTESLAWLESDGYQPSKIVLKNVKTGATEEIIFQSDSTDQHSDQESDVDLLNMVVYLNDRYNMSGNTFVYMYTFSPICV